MIGQALTPNYPVCFEDLQWTMNFNLKMTSQPSIPTKDNDAIP